MNIYTQNCVIRDKVIFLHHHLSRSPSEFLHQLGLFYTSSVSTVSTFLHLWFRDERVHRLLVPTLFLDLLTQLPLSLNYFAPLNPACQNHYEGLNITNTTKCQLFYSTNQLSFTKNDTYLSQLQEEYRGPNPHQAWTLIYIFVFSQMMTYWFCVFHPNHNKPEESVQSYCGSTRGGCTKKPFNCLTKVFCCLNFVFKPASTPEEFVSAVKWFLGGPIRLAILPGLLIGIVQAAHNIFPYFGGPFPFFPYMLIFIFGFTMAATDEDFTKNIMKK